MSLTKTKKIIVAKQVEVQQKTMLQQAHDLVYGERQQDYGTPVKNFTQIAMVWNGLLAHKLSKPITAVDVTLLMDGLKSVRLMNSPDHADSWIDKAGYTACGGELIPDGVESGEVLPGLLAL